MRLINLKIALLLVGLFYIIRKFMNSYSIKPVGGVPDALKRVSQVYGKEFAQNVERVLRHETRHFKSGQWLSTGTAGMVAFGESFPYGWNSLRQFADRKGLTANDFFLKTFNKASNGKKMTYIGFRNTGDYVEFFSWFIKEKRGGNLNAWFSLDPEDQKRYYSLWSKVTPKFV